jgi:hypothetical protein
MSVFDEQEALARAQWRSGTSYPFTYYNPRSLVVNPLGTITITNNVAVIQANTSTLTLSCPAGNGAPTDGANKEYRFFIYDASGNQYGAPIFATWSASVLSATLTWIVPPNYTDFSVVATYGTKGDVTTYAKSAPAFIPPLVIDLPDLIDSYNLFNPQIGYIAKVNFLTIADVQPDTGVLPPPNGSSLVYNVRLTGLTPTPIDPVNLLVVTSGNQLATATDFVVVPGTDYQMELLVGTAGNPTEYKVIPFDSEFTATPLVLADKTTFVLTNTDVGVASLVVPMDGQTGGILATPTATNVYTWQLKSKSGLVYTTIASGNFIYTGGTGPTLSTGNVSGLVVGSTYAFVFQHGSPLLPLFYQSLQGDDFVATNGVTTNPISSDFISVSSAPNVLQVVYNVTNSTYPYALANPLPANPPPALIQYQVKWTSAGGSNPFTDFSQEMYQQQATMIEFPWINTDPNFLAYVWYRGQFRLMVDSVQQQLSPFYNCATCAGIFALSPAYTLGVGVATTWTFSAGLDNPSYGDNINPGENVWNYKLVVTLSGFRTKLLPTSSTDEGRSLTWNVPTAIDTGTDVYVELQAVMGLDSWIFSTSQPVPYPSPPI